MNYKVYTMGPLIMWNVRTCVADIFLYQNCTTFGVRKKVYKSISIITRDRGVVQCEYEIFPALFNAQ